MSRPDADELNAAIQEVINEIDKEDQRPYPDEDPVRGAALVCEEAGETIQAALDMTRQPGIGIEANKAELHKEACHTAAVAVRLMMATNGG